MKRYALRYELKDRAKDNLRGSYSTLILSEFLFWLIIFVIIMVFGFSYAISLTAALYSGSAVGAFSLRLYQFGCLAGEVVSGFQSFGITFLCLSIACGQHVNYQDVFVGMQREYLPKVLGLTLVRIVVNLICLGAGSYFFLEFSASLDAKWLLAALFSYIIGLCAYIPVSLALDLVYFLLLDFPDKKTGEILRDSFRIIRGNRRRLFLLELSFLPLQFLNLLTLGLGSLWLKPYMQMTYTGFYLDLMNPENNARSIYG